MNTCKLLICFLLAANFLAAQEIETYDTFDEFEEALSQDLNKTYVVNYWATWCAPCVKELPFFETLHKDYKDKGVEVVLVSIDFKNQYEKRLIPFLKKKKYTARIIHMADPKPNNWIDRVDDSWSGAIPVTVLSQGNRNLFINHEFESYNDLKLELEEFLNN